MKYVVYCVCKIGIYICTYFVPVSENVLNGLLLPPPGDPNRYVGVST